MQLYRDYDDNNDDNDNNEDDDLHVCVIFCPFLFTKSRVVIFDIPKQRFHTIYTFSVG